MKIFYLFIYSAATCCDIAAITFEEALAAAYNYSREWLSSQTEKRVADETFSSSKMMFLPSVQGTISTSRIKSRTNSINDPTEIQRALGQTEPIKSRDRRISSSTRMDVSVSQNLFNGFATMNTMQANENLSKAAYHKLRVAEQSLIIKVLEVYVNVWVGYQKVAAMKKKEDNLKKTLDSQTSMMAAGIGTQSEKAQAEANYQKAVYERINSETELFSAESEFEKLTGLKADKNLKLPNLNVDFPKNLDALIAQAMSYNHYIKYYKLVEQSEVDKLAATIGRLSPTCDLSLRKTRSLNKQKYLNSENDYIASLEVTVPIFSNPQSSGNTYSAINIANQQALKARFSAEDSILEIKKECIVNWNKFISAKAMIESSQSAVSSAETSSKSNREETAMGLRSNIEVLDRENRLLESKIDLVNAIKQKVVAAMQLYALTGNLSLNSVSKMK